MRLLLALLLSTTLLAGCASLGSFNQAGYQKKYGLYVEHSKVQTFCLLPKLRFVLWKVENHFGRAPVVTSGYRNPWQNFKVGGARSSYHQKCMAADIFVPGISKSKLIRFLKQTGEVGGLGCYPGRKFVHIDIRGRPKGYKQPVLFNGC